MKAETPASVLIALLAWVGIQACSNDNAPSYRIIEERLAANHGTDGVSDETATGLSSDATGESEQSSAEATTSETSGSSEPVATEGDASVGMSGLDGGDSTAGSMTTDEGTSAGEEYTVELDPSSPYYPPCGASRTLADEEIKKGTACTSEDIQLCFRECGPFSVGWKTETCTAGVYAEGDCSFPLDGDYSCFAIPAEIDTSICPTTAPPQSLGECNVPECTLCNLNGQYFDTASNAKEGFCVCREPDETGLRTWTCASSTAWPCPFGRGC